MSIMHLLIIFKYFLVFENQSNLFWFHGLLLKLQQFNSIATGVMNQKMPYFGLHDANHLVALSRNRMYVNLMNLDSGDLVTTFKAGEDRFLNSLLVSGDGR